eukprot:5701170-Pleurochrysis_carterae.AAC.1
MSTACHLRLTYATLHCLARVGSSHVPMATSVMDDEKHVFIAATRSAPRITGLRKLLVDECRRPFPQFLGNGRILRLPAGLALARDRYQVLGLDALKVGHDERAHDSEGGRVNVPVYQPFETLYEPLRSGGEAKQLALHAARVDGMRANLRLAAVKLFGEVDVAQLRPA